MYYVTCIRDTRLSKVLETEKINTGNMYHVLFIEKNYSSPVYVINYTVIFFSGGQAFIWNALLY